MGIPQIKRHLEPYADRAALEPCSTVLDGPALAYHILAVCSRSTKRTSPFEQPSYGLLGKTAVAWLDQIKACGLTISAIYFDSYLPSSKRPERIQRLIKSSRELIRYHSSFLAGVPKHNLRRGGEADVELFPDPSPLEKHAKPPPPPFLVPAVIDALRCSAKYGPLVRLVPGEADGFCAQHVRSKGGLILTSDSDLLIHHLGPDGSVVFFSDIDIDTETRRLVAPRYCPADICRRLSIKSDSGLTHLAFEVNRDPHLSLEQAIQRSKGGDAESIYGQEYSSFVEQYLVPEVAPGLEADQVSALDPRVSELALRSLRGSGTATPVGQNISTDLVNSDYKLEMYLPFLLDYPSRTSAWEASKSVRQLAYGILQSVSGHTIPSVSEMRRMQTASSGSKIDVPDLSQIDELAASLLALLSKIEAGVSNPQATWTVFSIYQDVAMTMERARGYPLSFDILGRQTRGTLDECSWDFLHSVAQTQATYYSFRILSQVLDFAAHRKGALPPTVLRLSTFLSRLPPLSEFPSPGTFADMLRLVRESGGLSCLEGLCADFEDILPHIEAIQRPQETKKTKKRKAQVLTEEGRPKARSNNLFDLLASREE
ncbi:hypothetical protein VTK26DRAFT_3150 [Humicola hyalothermophila]